MKSSKNKIFIKIVKQSYVLNSKSAPPVPIVHGVGRGRGRRAGGAAAEEKEERRKEKERKEKERKGKGKHQIVLRKRSVSNRPGL